jgi:hypothetical protein
MGQKNQQNNRIFTRKMQKDAININIARKEAMPTAATRIIKDFDSNRTLATIGTPATARMPATARITATSRMPSTARMPPTAGTPGTAGTAATSARYANSRWNVCDSS